MLEYRAKPGVSNLDVWRKVRHPSRAPTGEIHFRSVSILPSPQTLNLGMSVAPGFHDSWRDH